LYLITAYDDSEAPAFCVRNFAGDLELTVPDCHVLNVIAVSERDAIGICHDLPVVFDPKLYFCWLLLRGTMN
jgi:hypothetical protein